MPLMVPALGFCPSQESLCLGGGRLEVLQGRASASHSFREFPQSLGPALCTMSLNEAFD